MNTVFLLMAQFGGRFIIPLDEVRQHFFPHVTTELLARKIATAEIALPIVRMEDGSQKSARGIHIEDLAAYLDRRIEAGRKECRQMTAPRPANDRGRRGAA